MANKNTLMWVGIAIVALIVVGMLIQSKYGLFALLPAGQYNTYGDCVFNTNVDPVTAAYSAYTGADAWVAIDINGDNNKEVFGWASTSSSSGRMYGCGRGGTQEILVNDFNSAGDDIGLYYTGGHNRIYVCSADGTQAKYFIQDSGAAANAIKTCQTTCTPSWTCGSWSTCANSVQTRTCTDSNNCGVTTGKPATSQSCSSGGTCPTMQDLINYANNWVSCG